LLRAVRAALEPGDALLLGTDLRKDAQRLIAAYDDTAGVTAAFNKNVLVRLNRELGADFDVERFQHRAVWNRGASRIEMHLESTVNQVVQLRQLGMTFAFVAGERIHTESSYKYDDAMVNEMLIPAGFRQERTFTDEDRLFAVRLARAV
jgi:L-histidine Nalpha-methyltransferase